MKFVGITGGIGSGKTICCQIFRLLGVKVYMADLEAKRIMNSSEDVRKEIISLFGPKSYFQNGELNRPYLAKLIFKDRELLKKMNAIVHPAVRVDFLSWATSYIEEPYVLQESALLFESSLHRFFHKTILVTAPEPLRLSRVMKRDNLTENQVRERMSNQVAPEQVVHLADYVIENDGALPLIPQIIAIHKALMEYATAPR